MDKGHLGQDCPFPCVSVTDYNMNIDTLIYKKKKAKLLQRDS